MSQKIAYVYKEIYITSNNSKEKQTKYFISFAGNCSRGCKLIEITDEYLMKEELNVQRRRGVTLISKLPPKLPKVDEGIERKPYSLPWLK